MFLHQVRKKKVIVPLKSLCILASWIFLGNVTAITITQLLLYPLPNIWIPQSELMQEKSNSSTYMKRIKEVGITDCQLYQAGFQGAKVLGR